MKNRSVTDSLMNKNMWKQGADGLCPLLKSLKPTCTLWLDSQYELVNDFDFIIFYCWALSLFISVFIILYRFILFSYLAF